MRIISGSYPTAFVGRTTEIRDIVARLEDPTCRLLTIIGLGGSGKTRLALEAMHRTTHAFPHGAVYVELQPLPRSELIVPAIAQAVGLMFYSDDALYDQLLDYLRDKTMLLLLDTFEHLLDGAALLSMILASAPGVKVLATSREALHIHEEWLYPLAGLSLPLSVYAAKLEDYEAIQLFLAHVRRVRPDFDFANEHDAVLRICQFTAGLPLAIELTASLLRGAHTAQIAYEMQRNLDVVATTARNVEERHRSMRAVLDHSWQLLSAAEQHIFAQLSVFPGSFDGSAAEQVAGASFAHLTRLVEQSFVYLEAHNRYGIHELLRQYGRERLAANEQTHTTSKRHSQYFAHQMQRYEAALKQSLYLETMEVIERDFDNVRLAWEWSIAHQQTAYLQTMLHGLYLFGLLSNRFQETIALFQQALKQVDLDTPLHGQLLARRWGYLYWWYHADYNELATSIEHALNIAHAGDDQFEIAFCYLIAAYAMMQLEQYSEAVPRLESSLALFEARNEPYYVCWVLHRLGYVYFYLNDVITSHSYSEQSLALARATYNREAHVLCLYNLGSDYTLDGDAHKGYQYASEALQLANETGNKQHIANILSLFALSALCQGDLWNCQEYAEQAQAVSDDIRSLVIQPYSFTFLILLACVREEYSEALQLNAAWQQHGTSTADLQLRDWVHAVIACGLDSPTDARISIQQVLQRAVPGVYSTILLWLFPCAAAVMATTDPRQAIALLAWISTSSDPRLLWAHNWPLLERLRTQLQSVLDADSYYQHWEQGRAWSFETITVMLYEMFTPIDERSAPDQLLSPREQEILRLMATGMTNPQIAARLVIGTGTVKTHTLNIYRKLEVANRTQAIRRAQDLALLDA